MIHVYNSIQENEDDYKSTYFILLLYSFAQGFAGMYSTRSQIASMLCLSAFCDLNRNKNIRFFIKVIIATSFHLMAVTFVLVFFLAKYKGSYRRYIKLLLLATAVILVTPTIVINFLSRIPALSRYALMYITSTSGNLSVMGLLQWGILLVAFIYARRYATIKYYDTCLMIYTLGFAMYIWASVYSAYFNRVAGIFLGSALFMIPSLFKAFKGKQSLIIFGIFGLYCFMAFYVLLNGEYSVLYLPYKSIFDDFSVTTDIR